MLPLLFGAGMQLTPSLSTDTGLTLERSRNLPGGAVELVYAVSERESESAIHDESWASASQRATR